MKPQKVTKSALKQLRSRLQKELDELQEKVKAKTKEVEDLKASLESLRNGNLHLWQILQNLNSPHQENSSLTDHKTGLLHKGTASFPDYLQRNIHSAHSKSFNVEVLTNRSHSEAYQKMQAKTRMNNKFINRSSNDMKILAAKFREDKDFQNQNTNDGVRIYNPIKSSLPPPPREFQVLRQVDSTSLLVWWNPPSGPGTSGYEIYANGTLHYQARSGSRTKALLQNLNLDGQVHLSLYAVSALGRSTKPAKLIYNGGSKSVGGASNRPILHSYSDNRRQERILLNSHQAYRLAAPSHLTMPYDNTPIPPLYPKMSNCISTQCHDSIIPQNSIPQNIPRISTHCLNSTLLMPTNEHTSYEDQSNIKPEKDEIEPCETQNNKLSQKVEYNENKTLDYKEELQTTEMSFIATNINNKTYDNSNPNLFHEQPEFKFSTRVSKEVDHSSSTSIISPELLKSELFPLLQQELSKSKNTADQVTTLIREKQNLNELPDLETKFETSAALELEKDICDEQLNKTPIIQIINPEYDVEKDLFNYLNFKNEMPKTQFQDIIYELELNNLTPEYQMHKGEIYHNELAKELLKLDVFSLLQQEYKYILNQFTTLTTEKQNLNKPSDLGTKLDTSNSPAALQLEKSICDKMHNKILTEHMNAEYDLENSLFNYFHLKNENPEYLFHELIYKPDLNNLASDHQKYEEETNHDEMSIDPVIPFPDHTDQSENSSQCSEHMKKSDSIFTIYITKNTLPSETSVLENESQHSNENRDLKETQADISASCSTKMEISKEILLDNLSQTLQIDSKKQFSKIIINNQLLDLSLLKENTLQIDESSNFSSAIFEPNSINYKGTSTTKYLPISCSKLNEEKNSLYSLNTNTETSEDYFTCLEEVSIHDSVNKFLLSNAYSNETQNDNEVGRENVKCIIHKEETDTNFQTNQVGALLPQPHVSVSESMARKDALNNVQKCYLVKREITPDKSKYDSNKDLKTFWKASGATVTHSEASLNATDSEERQDETVKEIIKSTFGTTVFNQLDFKNAMNILDESCQIKEITAISSCPENIRALQGSTETNVKKNENEEQFLLLDISPSFDKNVNFNLCKYR